VKEDKKMKKAFILMVAVVLGLTLSLSACGGGGSGSGGDAGTDTGSDAGKSVELTVVTSYGGDDGNRQNYEDSYKAWESETGNTVADNSATSNEEWKAKVNSDFETGTEPDVLFYFSGADADNIVSNGKVVPLSDIIAEYPDYAGNMNQDIFPASTADGNKYVVPTTGFWESLFVNKKVLEASGVEVPGADYTWEQFTSDCQKIKDAGYTPIAASLQEVPHYWWEFAVFNNDTVDTHLNVPATVDDPAGKAWVAALGDIKGLFDKGFFPENTLTAGDSDTFQLMYDDKAAFAIDGSWKINAFVENVPDNLDNFAVTYVPGKGERKATDIIGGFSMGYYITKKAWDDPAKKEAAVSFIEYMTSDDVLALFSSNGVSPTAQKEAASGGAAPNEFIASALAMFAGQTNSVGAVQDLLAEDARTDLFGGVKNVVSGSTKAADLTKEAVEMNAAQ
jgi:raffinose/stachyose/melibiose transport system substrate-binding protein